MLTFLRSSSLVLAIISRMSVPICNCFHARRGNISKITTFKMGTFLRLSAEASSNLRGRHLTGLLVSAFSAENFIGKLS